MGRTIICSGTNHYCNMGGQNCNMHAVERFIIVTWVGRTVKAAGKYHCKHAGRSTSSSISVLYQEWEEHTVNVSGSGKCYCKHVGRSTSSITVSYQEREEHTVNVSGKYLL